MVEKKPLTFEKDKEDQSKYYLSYPKLPVLDMKSANRDINVAEWANIPKAGIKKFAIFKYATSYWLHHMLPDHKMYCVSKVWFNALLYVRAYSSESSSFCNKQLDK